jgi:molybdopterin-guanine dinucleotide biosynthesis protein A
MNSENIHGFILAGGKSSRMGEDKARMKVEGKPLVVRAAEVLRPFVHQVTVLGSPERYADFGLPVVADQWQDQGPLAAICTGLLHSSAEWNIFLACDLPLLSSKFVQLLVMRIGASPSDAVVPRTTDGWQPLCAAYHARCLPVFMRGLEENRRSIVGLFDQLRVEAITADELASAGLSAHELANINTPEDWARMAEKLTGMTERNR